MIVHLTDGYTAFTMKLVIDALASPDHSRK